MPSIMEGSILIMSRAGTGTAMFSMGEIDSVSINFFVLLLSIMLLLSIKIL